MNETIKKYYSASLNSGNIYEGMDENTYLDKIQDKILDCYEEVNSVFGMDKVNLSKKLSEVCLVALSQIQTMGFDCELKLKESASFQETKSDESILFRNAKWRYYSTGYFKAKKMHIRIHITEILGQSIYRYTESVNSKTKIKYTFSIASDEVSEKEIINHLKTLKK